MTPPNISHLIDSRSSNLLREATALELDGVKVAIYIEYDGLTKCFVTDENFQPNWNAEPDAKITIAPTQISNEEEYKHGGSLSSDFASFSAFGSPAFSAPNSDMVRAELPLESGSFTQSNPSICVFGTPVLDSVESPSRAALCDSDTLLFGFCGISSTLFCIVKIRFPSCFAAAELLLLCGGLCGRQ
ncbi:hypothetical protein MGG_17213 [Pyricularia oryzae 70-15]|uniref:Uncharacterized protein n=1 Tax=Pyricularia oryzae (strain 70-15 / ATCC MYA-4617 / FGSC 8958) TaxID=242507 RepID=G4N8Q6_PYRO7|nr:uncharacterized protein MGG_17209 [Pyricularia oryzae 70-15]XP_003717376.1 uncharacterized protein MGG_17213 [Pyricularia oryzae 70-15]EHA51052.1 hypothetical protein MGG_17209 [Pyricularia oryzae 70-15]EHA51057.1 hypothetical protein MGG_17213 [Pyricularia oryzae 70-15]